MLQLIFTVLVANAVEMIVHVIPVSLRRLRTAIARVAIILFIVTSIIVLAEYLQLFTLLIVAIFAYRAFNMARIIKGRMHDQYAWHVTFRTSLWLMFFQIGIFGLWWVWNQTIFSGRAAIGLILTVQTIFLLLCIGSVRGHISRMRRAFTTPSQISTAELPSITVAIPARNETDELHACITSLLASDYPKLEILVLDDCSQTRRTPEIIRGFAHEGVRFINGEEPKDSWLAKNQAYGRLAEAASGEYIIFAGVDIRLEASTLRRLVSYAASRDKTMVCVMPHNDLVGGAIPIIQPMRYVWELAFPRKLVNKPPVLSSFWLIHKQALESVGGFKAAARMVVPEAYFARTQMKTNKYSFMAGSETLGVTSSKDVQAQRDTAIRVGYPSVHRRPETVVITTLLYVLWVAVPLIAIIQAILSSSLGLFVYVAIVIYAFQIILYIQIFRLSYGKTPLLAVCSFPLAALVYVGLLNYSMYKYEFSEVIWKGRNVCLPVMHVIPHLPQV